MIKEVWYPKTIWVSSGGLKPVSLYWVYIEVILCYLYIEDTELFLVYACMFASAANLFYHGHHQSTFGSQIYRQLVL